jgi:hypothetical protein
MNFYVLRLKVSSYFAEQQHNKNHNIDESESQCEIVESPMIDNYDKMLLKRFRYR